MKNKLETLKSIRENWGKYHINGMSNIHRVKRKALFLSKANSFEHEEEKFRICYELTQMGHEWITEAVDNKSGLRRDVIDLNTGEVFEAETDMKRATRFLNEPYGNAVKVNIRPVGWSFNDPKWIKLKNELNISQRNNIRQKNGYK
ncbi:MAG: hypothetical protein AABY22_21960 [Nanoarchaeota archaeon]